MIEFSTKLFDELKLIELAEEDESYCDMLLFQYGVYNWNDGAGEHFSFGIVRQFMLPPEDEPYQLFINLRYEPEAFKWVRGYSCWSDKFSGMEAFTTHIMTRKGFKKANKCVPAGYRVWLEQC